MGLSLQLMTNWIKQKRGEGVPVSGGPMLCEKATKQLSNDSTFVISPKMMGKLQSSSYHLMLHS